MPNAKHSPTYIIFEIGKDHGANIVSRSQPNRRKIVVPSLYGLISIALPKLDLSISTQHMWKSHGDCVAPGHMFKQNFSLNACYGL